MSAQLYFTCPYRQVMKLAKTTKESLEKVDALQCRFSEFDGGEAILPKVRAQFFESAISWSIMGFKAVKDCKDAARQQKAKAVLVDQMTILASETDGLQEGMVHPVLLSAAREYME